MTTDTDAFAARVAEIVLKGMRELPPTPLVLTTAEARHYVKCETYSSFHAWCQRWKVTSIRRGRWSRPSIDLAIEREIGIRNTPATLKRHQEGLRLS